MSNWIQISPLSGHGNVQITITAETLTSINDRVAQIVASNSQYGLSSLVSVSQLAAPTAITFSNVSWVTDVPASGGTASKDNCSYVVYANYGDGTQVNITTAATITGVINVPSTTTTTRNNIGTLTLTASYDGFSATTSVTAYQAAPSLTGIGFTSLTWAVDVPASGDTADKDNCLYTILAYYNVNITTDITNSATVSGDLVIPATTALTRESVGTLTLTASYSGFTTTGSVTAYQEAAVPVITGISFSSLLWMVDVPVSGGTADKNNCTYSIYANYNDGSHTNVTSSSTVSGSLVVPATTAETRENVGTLTLTATYSGFTTTGSVTAYQEACFPYSSEYLTFNITSNGKINWKGYHEASGSFSEPRTISYSVDNGTTWTDITSSAAGTSFNVNSGDKVLFKGNNINYGGNIDHSTFSGTTAGFTIEGNIMSLLYGDDFETNNTLRGAYSFCFLFHGCNRLTSVKNLALPATSLEFACYFNLFSKCTLLTDVPKLPATNLSIMCYSCMFSGCTSITTAPVLPSTTLASNCYSNMFCDCTSLTSAPELPATTLATDCYSWMFCDCTSLTSAPELPATTLAPWCYCDMFHGCTSLTSAPELPATTLVDNCYSWMFYYCSNLNYIKCLAIDISASNCTYNWVNGVSNSGTFVSSTFNTWTIGDNGIPSGWTTQNVDTTGLIISGLTWVTDVPASGGTATKDNCSYTVIKYVGGNSTDVTNSAVISGSLSVSGASSYDRKKVGTLTLTATYDNLETNKPIDVYQAAPSITGISFGLLEWVTDVPASGGTASIDNCTYSIYANYDAYYSSGITSTATVSGSLVVPATTATTRESVGDLTLTATYSGFSATSSVTAYQEEYVPIPTGTTEYLTFNITNDGNIKWKSSNNAIRKTISYSKDNGSTWTSITSSTAGTSFNVTAGDKVLFKGNNSSYCDGTNYNSFSGSTASYTLEGNIMSLIDSTGFATATTLSSNYALSRLFYNCKGLTSAENLVMPATSLTQGCYYYMFIYCSNLEKAPVLPAKVLLGSCYYGMFLYCSSLNHVKCMATNISASYCTYYWLSGVASTGTFVKNTNMSSWTTGESGIPSGWTVIDAT